MTNLGRRDFTRMGATVVALAAFGPIAGATRAKPAAQTPDALALVDPDLRPMALQLTQMASRFPRPSLQTLPTLRSMNASFELPPLDTIPFVERRVPGGRGAPDVRVYVVNAKPGTARPGILHTHGGGFIFGSARGSLRSLQELARTLDCTIVTVDYRLAPEARWQGSVEDNYAGLKWLHANAPELGVDRRRIAVMGESAGGGHAALLALRARDRGEVPLAFQMLIYPMLDDRTASSRAAPSHIGTLLWTGESNRFGWRSFLGQEPGGARVPAAAVPARATNLAGLPPTFIGVGSLDLFVAEDIGFAQRLIEAGGPTDLRVVPGAFHGFDAIAADTPVAKRFAETKVTVLSSALSLAPNVG